MNRQERSDAYARESKSRIVALLCGHHPGRISYGNPPGCPFLSMFMVKRRQMFFVEKHNGIFYLLELICRCVRVNIVSVQFF